MRKFSSQAAVYALIAALGIAAAGCGQISALKAKMAFKDANTAYQQQDYRTAAAKYEQVINLNPDLTYGYFFLGNSYDNLYRSSRKGEAANDALLTKAIANYKKSAEVEKDPKIKKLALEYLVAAYGPDKLNDPSQAEPVVQQLIQLDPTDPSNYFALAKIYSDNGEYDKAEEQYLKAKQVKPNDPAVYMQLAGFYNSQGQFDKTMEALNARAQQEPNNPEAYYTIATYYWDKAYHDFTTSPADKVKYVQAGLDAVDKAIQLKPDYFEALTYKNLLLRVQANLEKDPKKQQALLKEADQYRDKAESVRSKRTGAE